MVDIADGEKEYHIYHRNTSKKAYKTILIRTLPDWGFPTLQNKNLWIKLKMFSFWKQPKKQEVE